MEENNLNINLAAAEKDFGTGTPKAEQAYRVFDTQEEFQECIDKALGKRLGAARQTGERLEQLQSKCDEICLKFGIDDISALCGEDMQLSRAKARPDLSQDLKILCENSVISEEQATALASDQKLYALVENGFSLENAVKSLCLDDVIKKERQKAKDETVNEIRRRGLRPNEDALSGYGSFSSAFDPKNLTDEQRQDIRERVRRGERITF